MRPTTISLRHATALGALALMTLGGCKAAQPGTESSKSGDATTTTAATPATTSTAATPASTLDANLANPQVGDVWAAELSHFSRASFGVPPVNGQPGKAFGLMKVIRVTPSAVIAITEQGAWPEQRKSGSLDDLHGDFHDIRWDNSEEITINRSEFAALVAANQILETRRGAPVDAASSGGSSGGATSSKPAAPASNSGK